MSDHLDVVRRWVCSRCGPLHPGDRRTLNRPDYPSGTHTGCPERAVLVEYDRADLHRGAVKRAERAEALAVRLYRLMGEEAERVCPGELESSELLRRHFGGQ